MFEIYTHFMFGIFPNLKRIESNKNTNQVENDKKTKKSILYRATYIYIIFGFYEAKTERNNILKRHCGTVLQNSLLNDDKVKSEFVPDQQA